MATKTESIQIKGHDATKTIVTDDAGRIIRKSWTINEFDGNKNILYKEVVIKRFDTPDDHNILKQRTVYQKPPFSRFSFMNYVRTTKYANGHYFIEYGVRENDTEETYSTKELYSDDVYCYRIHEEEGEIATTRGRKDKTGYLDCSYLEIQKVFYVKEYTESGGYIEATYQGRNFYRKWEYNADGLLIEYSELNNFKRISFVEEYEYYEDTKTLKCKTTYDREDCTVYKEEFSKNSLIKQYASKTR